MLRATEDTYSQIWFTAPRWNIPVTKGEASQLCHATFFLASEIDLWQKWLAI